MFPFHFLYKINFKLYRHRPPTRKRIIEKDTGRRFGGLASLGPLGARFLKGNLIRIKEGASGVTLRSAPSAPGL